MEPRAVLGFRNEDDAQFVQVLGFIGVCVFVVLGALACWRWCLDSCAQDRSSRLALPADSGDSAKLLASEDLEHWLRTDTPVETADQDCFGHTRMARRIASRLLKTIPPAQAVVGCLGSGKTTVRNLTIEALRATKGRAVVRIVPIELWAFDTSRAAVSAIVQKLVDAVRADADVTGIIGLPTLYAELMSAAGGFWAAIVKVQGIPSTPDAALERLDNIATAIGIRYVLWVEDLERFAATAHSDPDLHSPE